MVLCPIFAAFHEVGADLFGIYEDDAEKKKKQSVPAANKLVRSASMISPEAVPDASRAAFFALFQLPESHIRQAFEWELACFKVFSHLVAMIPGAQGSIHVGVGTTDQYFSTELEDTVLLA